MGQGGRLTPTHPHPQKNYLTKGENSRFSQFLKLSNNVRPPPPKQKFLTPPLPGAKGSVAFIQ